MPGDESIQIKTIEASIQVLNQAIQKLSNHDYASAQVMVGVSKQLLEDVQLEFASHLKVAKTLKQILKQSLN